MARKVLIGLDLQWNNLEKLRLENVSSTIVDEKTAGKFAFNYLTKEAAIAYFNCDNTLKYKDKSGVKTIATIEDIGNNTNNFDILFGSFSVPIAVIADSTTFLNSAINGSVLKFTENKGFCYEGTLTDPSGAQTHNYYNVAATTKLTGTETTMKDIHKRGVCISIDGQIYKYYGDEFQCPTSNWKKVHQGIAFSAFSVVQTNAANGATAYGWGNHANQGYLTSSGVTGATKCKITYNSNGLVTAGADLTANDIPNLDASKITTGQFSSNRVNGSEKWDTAYNWVSFNGNKVLKGVVVGFDKDVTLPNRITPYDDLNDVVFEGFAIVNNESVAIYKNKTTLINQNHYRVVLSWGTSFGEPCNKTNLEIEGNLLSSKGAIWQYKNGEWVKVYDGKTDLDALVSRVDVIETMLNEDEEDTKKVIDTWEEVKNFLEGYKNDDTLAGHLASLGSSINSKLDEDFITLRSSGETVILGTDKSTVLTLGTIFVNGKESDVWLGTGKGTGVGMIYGPKTCGREGEILVSLGSGAPDWKPRVIEITSSDVNLVTWSYDGKSFGIPIWNKYGLKFCSVSLYEKTTSQDPFGGEVYTYTEIVADINFVKQTINGTTSFDLNVTFSEKYNVSDRGNLIIVLSA